MEYDAVQPFGDERANWHSAVIAQMLAAIHTPKNRQAPSVAEFMFRDEQDRKHDDEKRLLGWLRVMKNGKPC